MKAYEIVLMVLASPFVAAGLAAFALSHWTGYACGIVCGILQENWREFAEQFRLGRHHMTGDGENHQ